MAAQTGPIGAVTQVRSTAYGTPPSAPRAPVQIADPLVFKERLETLSFSALEANLNDGSVVTLGASAQVVLDEFVYDPGSATSGLLIDLGVGSLRFATGSMPKESFQLQTPTATLAIRGTNFRVRVRPNGDTLVVVDEGIVVVTVTSTGQIVEVRAGQSVEIKRTPVPPAPVKADDDTGGDPGTGEIIPSEGGDQSGSPTGIIIDGRLYYHEIEYNPDLALDVGNPVVDHGWSNVAVTGAGDRAIVLTVQSSPVKDLADRGIGGGLGQYGGDGCECGF